MSKMLWTEKYRPRSLDEIVGHQDLIRELKEYVREDFLPHLLFYGERGGTGKTSTALALKEELGWDMAKFNGSDQRRLKDYRERVKKALRTRSLVGKKIVFIDEAGELTSNAQRALKTPMQTYSSNASIIFVTNHINRINPRIKDRCYLYHFEPVPATKIAERLSYIARREDLDIPHDQLMDFAEEARGSVRKAIQLMRRSRHRRAERKAITV